MVIEYRDLRSEDSSLLEQFFLSLSDESVFNMNRFTGVLGSYNKDPGAHAMAWLQTSHISTEPGEEKGYLATTKDMGIENIIGYGFLRFSPYRPTQKYTCSLGIIVTDRFQHRGIGRWLMLTMIEDARKLGMRKIFLQVYESNLNAKQLYLKLGFKVEGRFIKQEWRDNKPLNVLSMGLFL